jgi:hypothetical protein
MPAVFQLPAFRTQLARKKPTVSPRWVLLFRIWYCPGAAPDQNEWVMPMSRPVVPLFAAPEVALTSETLAPPELLMLEYVT